MVIGVDEALHSLVERRLRQISQRYTTGRREVVEVLAGAGHPVSIEEIAELAPRLPRSSAYRHLVDLQQAGVVRRVSANDDYFRFELAEDITEHHHHLLCTSCGRVLDITPTAAFEQAMTKYLAGLAQDNGFLGTDHRLDVLGTCAGCRGQAGGHRAPHREVVQREVVQPEVGPRARVGATAGPTSAHE
jgi:Fur family transcriptional regulator, ferric uptake regulator